MVKPKEHSGDEVVQVKPGENVVDVIRRERYRLTYLVPPKGREPKIEENCRRVCLTKISVDGIMHLTRIDLD